MPRRPAIQLSTEDLLQVMELLKDVTSVELKVMVEDTARATVRHLGFDPTEAEPRQAYFFDTPDLALNRAGLIVRARRGAHGRGDTVVKLRPIDPAMIDSELRRDAAFKVEVDVMPGGFVCSASAKGRCSGKEVIDACEGKIPLEAIFSRAQREFYKDHAPAGVAMSDLVPLGPTFLLRMKQDPEAFDRPVVVELWLYPDGSRVLEVSTKGEPEEAFQLAAEFKKLLIGSGIAIEAIKATKTNSALTYFSKHMQPAPAA
jgi:hypothetical protein